MPFLFYLTLSGIKIRLTMSQILLNLKDESKKNVLLNFLKSLNYVSVQQLNNKDVIITESEKQIMRERHKKAKPDDFKNWDDIKDSFKINE